MADIGERGQMLLVGAVVFALVLVTLAFVLNTTIYSGTLAGQANEDVSSGDVTGFQESARSSTGSLLGSLNSYDYPGRSERRNKFTGRLDGQLTTLLQTRYAEQGAIIDLEHVDDTAGLRTAGDIDGGPDPNVDGNQVRNFTMDVNPDGGTFEVTIDPSGASATTVEISDGGPDPSDPTEVTVGTDTCSVPSSADRRISIDFARATIEGDHCNALDVFDDTSGADYTITFANRGDVTADSTYSLIEQDSPIGPPGEREVLYSATVELTYHDSTTDYDGEIVVKPKEL